MQRRLARVQHRLAGLDRSFFPVERVCAECPLLHGDGSGRSHAVRIWRTSLQNVPLQIRLRYSERAMRCAGGCWKAGAKSPGSRLLLVERVSRCLTQPLPVRPKQMKTISSAICTRTRSTPRRGRTSRHRRAGQPPDFEAEWAWLPLVACSTCSADSLGSGMAVVSKCCAQAHAPLSRNVIRLIPDDQTVS